MSKKKINYQIRFLKEKRNELIKKLNEVRINNIKEVLNLLFDLAKDTTEYFLPYIISLGLTTGAIYVFDGGLPFKKDKVYNSKYYSLEYTTNQKINYSEDYVRRNLFSETIPESEITIYTPIKKVNNLNVREKYYYKISKFVDKESFNKILDNDYEYIINNIENTYHETITSNIENEYTINDYFVEANIYLLDYEDKVSFLESNQKNLFISLLFTSLNALIILFIENNRDVTLMEYKNNVKLDIFSLELKDTSKLKGEIKEKDRQILLYSKKVNKR